MLCGFLGLWLIAEWLIAHTSLPVYLLGLICFFTPSLLFWSAGIVKESIALFAMGLILNHMQGILKWLLLLIGIGLLFISKFYLPIAFGAFILYQLGRPGKLKLKASIVSTVYFFLLALFCLVFNEQIVDFFAANQREFIDLARSSGAASAFSITPFTHIQELFTTIPQAFYRLYLLPVVTIQSNPFSIINALESGILLVVWIFPLLYFKKPPDQKTAAVSLSISFIVLLSIFIGECVPIIGAMVRYRIVLLPFYLSLVFQLTDIKKIPFLRSLWIFSKKSPPAC
jgi:hypothetical protein